ncbi:VOC family protein [Actinomadura formosensis]|uniref:VOC family protein n=1 Tax=Actinomadura formosensis TaxID=60706 RepID=UPI000B267A24|nr:VOC family protein [Actinomadura formosensis]
MNKVSALGYLVVRGPLDRWHEFGTQILGAQLAGDGGSGPARFRTDERAWRIEVQDGPPGPDTLIAIGFEVANEEDLEAVVRRLTARGVTVTEDDGLSEARRVRRVVAFKDPDGNRIEMFVGAELSKAPFISPRGVRFVCGDLGLGHVFMLSGDSAAAARFYQDDLGFRLSDTIALGPENGYFLHCNPRHHSIAFASIPGPPPGLGHLMLEVDSLEAVGRALDIATAGNHPIQMSLGEHTNDHMTSFYVVTPSGFAVEYGCNGRLVDAADWKVAHYDAPSVWGHHFNVSAMPGADPAAGKVTS